MAGNNILVVLVATAFLVFAAAQPALLVWTMVRPERRRRKMAIGARRGADL